MGVPPDDLSTADALRELQVANVFDPGQPGARRSLGRSARVTSNRSVATEVSHRLAEVRRPFLDQEDSPTRDHALIPFSVCSECTYGALLERMHDAGLIEYVDDERGLSRKWGRLRFGKISESSAWTSTLAAQTFSSPTLTESMAPRVTPLA